MKKRARSSAKNLVRELGDSPYFRGMSRKALEEMARSFQERVFDKGSVVVKEGGRARALFILSRGALALFLRRGREELIIEIVNKKGSIFGWSALIPPHKYTATAKALEESRVFSVQGRDLERLFRKYPSSGWLFMQKLSTVIATRLSHTRALLADTLT